MNIKKKSFSSYKEWERACPLMQKDVMGIFGEDCIDCEYFEGCNWREYFPMGEYE